MDMEQITSVTTLTQMLDRLSETEQHGIYIYESSKHSFFLSYAALRKKALAQQNRLRNSKLAAGDICILLLQGLEDFIVNLWACLYAGIRAVPLPVSDTTSGRDKIVNVTRQTGAYILHSDAEVKFLSKLFSDQSVNLIHIHKSPSGTHYLPVSPQAADIAYVQFSSGSTGSPKGIALTHDNLLANILDIYEPLVLDSNTERSLSWQPLTHDMGLIGFHLTPLFAGIDQHLMQPKMFIRNPIRWLELIDTHKISITSAPNFSMRFLLNTLKRRKTVPEVNLASLRLIFCGAEPIDAELCREYTYRLADFQLNPGALFPVYGLAEACLAVSFPEPSAPLTTLSVNRKQLQLGESVEIIATGEGMELVSVGKPLSQVRVKLVDDAGWSLSEGKIGKLHIAGRNITQTLWTDQGRLNVGDWLDTGDIAVMHQGELYILGRSKDILYVQGRNAYSHDLELLLEHKLQIAERKLVVTDYYCQQTRRREILVLFTDPKLKDDITLQANIRQTLFQALGQPPKHIVWIAEIPFTTSGKKQRQLMLDNCLDQGLIPTPQTQPQADDNSISNEHSNTEKVMLEHAWTVFGDTSIRCHTPFANYILDSLLLQQYVACLENTYPNRLSISDFFRFSSIADVAAEIDKTDKNDLHSSFAAPDTQEHRIRLSLKNNPLPTEIRVPFAYALLVLALREIEPQEYAEHIYLDNKNNVNKLSFTLEDNFDHLLKRISHIIDTPSTGGTETYYHLYQQREQAITASCFFSDQTINIQLYIPRNSRSPDWVVKIGSTVTAYAHAVLDSNAYA